MTAALGVDFGTCGREVGLPVGGRFELVGEEATAGSVGGGEGAGPVDKVLWVDDGSRRYAVDGGAEFEEERGFFGGLVGGHAAEGRRGVECGVSGMVTLLNGECFLGGQKEGGGRREDEGGRGKEGRGFWRDGKGEKGGGKEGI